jgi:hypothetical protein
MNFGLSVLSFFLFSLFCFIFFWGIYLLFVVCVFFPLCSLFLLSVFLLYLISVFNILCSICILFFLNFYVLVLCYILFFAFFLSYKISFNIVNGNYTSVVTRVKERFPGSGSIEVCFNTPPGVSCISEDCTMSKLSQD